MRRPVLRILLCAVLLFFVPLTLVWFCFALPPQYDETFLGGLACKMNALRAADGPRIILAGGSGAAFAVRSDLMETEFPGYRAVNLGMYAGLGSTVPLDVAECELRQGDLVIFLPEMNGQTLSLYFGSEAMWQAVDGNWELLSTLYATQLRAMLGRFPSFAARKAAFCFSGDKPRGDGIYTRSAFSARGDIDSGLRDRNTMPEGYDPDQRIVFADLRPDEAFFTYLNEYAERCEIRGIQFFFAFAPANSAAADPEGAAECTARMQAGLRCPVLGSAGASLMEAGWFYDTNFHLNSAGAVVFTDRLVRWLKTALGMEPETSIALPSLPGTWKEVLLQGENGDAGYFVYEVREAGMWVTGLTPEGRERRSLTVPAVAEGKPVTGFDAAVFAGSSVLESVTVQANIRHIPDGAFEGCSALREVRLKDVAPSACTVGRELLRGTNAGITVDRERIAAYLTDYFWSVHAPRITAPDPETATAVPATAAPLPADGLCFDGNGGYLADGSGNTRLEQEMADTHLRQNTLNAAAFLRPGYVLTGWNTQPDGSGTGIGPGWRCTAEPGTVLYAQWMPETDAAHFLWKKESEESEEAWIVGWQGTERTCVLPAYLGDLPVRGIRSGAFRDADLDTVVLPQTLRTVEDGAFDGCTLQTLYLCDSLETVSDAAFTGCDRLRTLRIAAAVPPVYSISYYATFADKYDRLLCLAGRKKLVLFSGSSTRYGYDSKAIERAYPACHVVNMGVYAYTNAMPQLDLIRQGMEAGDVLLHAPEFDCLNFQMCENNRLDFHFWAMMEADYGCVARLDLRAYSGVFDSLQQYLRIRRSLPTRSYAETPALYDDDGHFVGAPTYNECGDMITTRAKGKGDVMLQHVRADYTPEPFTEFRLESLNRMYQTFLDREILVLFTYTPRNRSSLTEESTPEQRQALHRLLREKLCVPVISGMEDALMSGEYFYIVDSHLGNEGARLRTLKIIEDLKPWL